MPSIYVPLTREAADLLVELARRERRHPRDQAALLLERVLPAALEAIRSVQDGEHRATIAESE